MHENFTTAADEQVDNDTSWQSCSTQVWTWTVVRFSSMWTLDWKDFGLDAGLSLGNSDLMCLITSAIPVKCTFQSPICYVVVQSLNVPPNTLQVISGTIFAGRMTKPTVSKHWRKPVGLSDKAWIPPAPLHHVTIIQLLATASMHGVTVPMWQTQSPIC